MCHTIIDGSRYAFGEKTGSAREVAYSFSLWLFLLQTLKQPASCVPSVRVSGKGLPAKVGPCVCSPGILPFENQDFFPLNATRDPPNSAVLGLIWVSLMSPWAWDMLGWRWDGEVVQAQVPGIFPDLPRKINHPV